MLQPRRMMQMKYCFMLGFATLLTLNAACNQQAYAQEQVEIDARAQATPFPHFWEQMFGSGRAILSLRESYRDDLRAVKQVADFRYVRFHAVLHDEVGVYNKDEHGINPTQQPSKAMAQIESAKNTWTLPCKNSRF